MPKEKKYTEREWYGKHSTTTQKLLSENRVSYYIATKHECPAIFEYTGELKAMITWDKLIQRWRLRSVHVLSDQLPINFCPFCGQSAVEMSKQPLPPDQTGCPTIKKEGIAYWQAQATK